MIRLDIRIAGNGSQDLLKGHIVGFSDRLNTILVPEAFMQWANEKYGERKAANPSRLILEVHNPADERIAQYFQKKVMKQKIINWILENNLVLES